MLKFFRHIRRNLLYEGKTVKYLKYAIGEIVLVVIGILIALAINNANERRKDAAKEQAVLRQLQEDYQANLLQLEEKIGMREQMIRSCFQILDYIDHPARANRDSLISHFSNLLVDPTFDPIQNDLVVSGNIRLLRNVQLKQLLTRWTSEVVQLTEVEREWQKIRSEVYMPFSISSGIAREVTDAFWRDEDPPVFILSQNIRINFTIGKSAHTPELGTLLDYSELEGIVVNAFTLNHVGNLQSQVLHDRIEEILALIEADLYQE